MPIDLNRMDRRRFLRGTGLALAIPMLGSLHRMARGEENSNPRRLGCFYFPDGVPMPLPNDPAYQDWSWFPHGNGADFKFSKCMETLEPLRSELTILSGFSHIAARNVHGHNNADQFLTAASLGQGDQDYANTISLDQVYASHIGDQTRFSSLVMSTDGGTGTARGTHTISFDKHGRPIPAEHRPKHVFDMLFVKADAKSAKRLAMSRSALDEVLQDAKNLKQDLSIEDRKNLDEYMESVRQAELKVEKAKKWLDAPLPNLEREPLNLELTTDQPREYLQIMFELVYLAFRTDSTRIATYQIGRLFGLGLG